MNIEIIVLIVSGCFNGITWLMLYVINERISENELYQNTMLRAILKTQKRVKGVEVEE